MAKRNTHFHFKQFSVQHEHATMKVGTDGVLLGAWVNLNHATSVLDIGTGCGLIALMLAQRTPAEARIDAVEIERKDADQANQNVLHSPWPEKITVHHTPIQQFQPPDRYDLIVSNPPYFSNSYAPPDVKRVQTRHTTSLPFSALLESVLRLLHPQGKFNLVLPYTEGLHFIALAMAKGLWCTRQWSFRSRLGKPVERWLLEFSLESTPKETGEILHYDAGDAWSAEYKKLTREFYLRA